jgi:uncharacterized membrane protein
MHLIAYNFSWMGFNTFLAIIPLILGWLFYLTKNKITKYFHGVFWLLFLPNTIYLFTDILNLIRQWGMVGAPERLVFVFQYSVLTIIGLVTFVLSLYPFEKFIKNTKYAKRGAAIIIVLNFIIGFGITLGRVERINSWDVVFRPESVVASSLNIIFSVELMFLTLLFGLLGNFIYFLFRDPLIKYFSTYADRFVEKQ